MWDTKLGSFLLVVVFAATSTLGQTPSGPQSPIFLVRMERLYNGEDVCILVNDEGSYHLERVFRAKSQVYVGSFNATSLKDLTALLNGEKLRNLSQQAIAAALNSETLDHFWIAINREDALQNLSFANVASRNPYRESVDPLLTWLDSVEKDRPGATETGGTPTHCLPPKANRLLILRAQPAAEERSGQLPIAPRSVLFQIVAEHYRGGDADRSCAVVYSDNRFRVEKSHQSLSSSPRSKIYENSLQPNQMEDLKQILDAPDLKALEHRNLPQPYKLFHDADITQLTIPRPSGSQALAFSSYFNTSGGMSEAGGKSNLQYGVGNDNRVLKPLEKWIKANLEGGKNAPLANAVANGCLPSQE